MAKKTVAVFGAGVAGLTAAHELVIRGFDVTVYDPELNHVIGVRTYDRGIGGMARSQFVVDDKPARASGEIVQLQPATDFLRDATFEFEIDKGSVVRVHARPDTLADRFKALVAKLVERNQLSKLQIFLPIAEDTKELRTSSDPRFKYVASLVESIVKPEVLEKSCLNFTVLAMPRENMVFFGTGFDIFPAEHGFRFFPSFYRHLFDTMKRTPILNPRKHEYGRTSVYQNLIPVDSLGFARAGKATSFLMPRHPPTSLEQFRLNLRKVLGELNWSGEDLNRFGLKLFQYMTTCSKRRAAEYEDMSWGEFVELQSYSKVMQEHLEFGPQMMASLRGSESDARTQGTIVVQLLLDQLREGMRPDCTLAGPTSGMWFDHWHDYLVDQGVKFERGEVTGFDVTSGKCVPLDHEKPVVTDYVVFALPLEPMAKIASELRKTLAARRVTDLDRVIDFLGDSPIPGVPTKSGPLRHMSGIQFYFDTEVKFWRGHTQYLDSEWGLTSIAQPQFWSRERNPSDPYRSLLSVDIGIWDRDTKPFRNNALTKRRASRPIPKGSDTIAAAQCDPKRLAKEVWAQIEDHHDESFTAAYGEHARLPYPRWFALDAGLAFNERGLANNRYLFVVNRVGRFGLRPGKLAATEPKALPQYELIDNRFVLAGTHMKTYTRITSMESANESARHAVNAILAHADVACDRCEIWDPEDHELPDFQWLKDLDEKLFDRHLPHLTKILGWSELPALLSPSVDQALLAKGIRF